jgi:hypothetical protein
MKTPNPDHPIRNTFVRLALASTMGAAMFFGASPATAAPPVTADLKLHLDASQLTGLSDGATVTTWTDMSGQNNHATATGTPIYKPGVLNGQPVIRFNGASGFTTADLSSQFPSAATVFIATTINTDNAYTLVKANPGVDEWWRYDGNGNSYPGVFRGNRLEAYCPMPNSGSHLFAISSSASAWEMAINGDSKGVAGGNYNAGGALVIGNGSSGGGLNGDIAEVLIYSRVLSAEETNAVGYFLEAKYGISSTYTDPDPNAGPVGLQAIAGDGHVSLTWAAKPGAVSYNVKRSETQGSGYTVVGTPTGPSFTDSPLVNGTPYYYIVSALNPSETSNSSETSATPTGVNATLSTVTGSQPALRANGVDSVTITVTLRNSSNTPVANKIVSLAQTTGSGATITTVTDTTGADGKAVFTATSTTVGPAVFTATDTTDSLVIVQTAAVDFVDANTPQSINVNFTGGTPETASSLSGPAGGLGTNWNQFTGPNSAGVVLDSLGTATTVTITSNFGLPNTFDGAVIALPMLRGSMTNFGKGVDNTNVTINGLEAGGFYNIWMVTLRNQPYNGTGTEQYVGWWRTTHASTSPSDQLVNAVGATVNTSTFVAGYNYVLFEKVEANGSGQIVFTGVAGPLLDGSNNNHRHGLNGLQIEKTTAPVIGIVTDADSTVDASPATVFADGVLTSTVTVTLKDANGTGVPGKEVTLANTSGPQAATINPLTAVTTNGAGQAVFTVSSATPGIEVFTATAVTDTLTLTDTASVEFLVIGVLTDSAKSTVAASPVARLADGLSTSTITVTLRDANGYPVSGKNVTLANSGGPQAAAISPLGAVASNASGQAVFSVTSSTIGVEEFTATDTTDSIVVTQIATVGFIDPNAPKLINVNFAGAAAEVASALSGPAGGLGTAWNQLLNISNASGTLQDSTGTMTTVSISHTYNLFADDNPTTLPIFQGSVANFGKGSGSAATVTLSGLASGGVYDIWLVLLRNQPFEFGGDGTEQYYGNWSTTNATSSSSSQLLDAVDPTINTATFVAGYNYVLFKNVVADGSGNIVFTGTPADSAPGVTHRLGLNGLQIQEAAPVTGFGTWASTNGATGQTPAQDHDNDGVENGIEYFMGQTGSSFTAMPGLDPTNKVSWPMSPTYAGTYEVQTSPDLVNWTNVFPKPTPSGGTLSYLLPTGAPGGKSFVRLLVTPTP